MRTLVLSASLYATTAYATPLEIESSGRLLGATGQPIEGAHDVEIELWDAATDGTLLWSDTFATTLTGGYYSVRLGSGPVPLEEADFSGPTPWIQVRVDEADVGGRSPLASVPFALRAASADGEGSVGSEAVERVSVWPSCTVASCVMETRSGGVIGVTRTALGNYTIQFATGLYQTTPSCSVMAEGSSAIATLTGTARTPTSFSFRTGDTAGTAMDRAFSVVCAGPRATSSSSGCLTSGTQPFASTGGDQTFTVPSGCTTVQIHAWGGGGAAGNAGAGYTASGGGGGYALATLDVFSGEVLTLIVGKAGTKGAGNPAAYGGGGASGNIYTGGGGGRSAIRRGTDELVTAGGGGGGGTSSGSGGGGGGASGVAGGVYSSATGGGGGGPGSGGAAGAGTGSTGSPGTAFNGGASPSPTGYPAGAGGGGWYGGGAGGHSPGAIASGGGGGSGRLGAGAVGTLTTASGTSPGGASEPLRAGAGDGGVSSGSGTDGRIVVIWGP